jgi:hypothetical protein
MNLVFLRSRLGEEALPVNGPEPPPLAEQRGKLDRALAIDYS